jgi:hypothetical protein
MHVHYPAVPWASLSNCFILAQNIRSGPGHGGTAMLLSGYVQPVTGECAHELSQLQQALAAAVYSMPLCRKHDTVPRRMATHRKQQPAVAASQSLAPRGSSNGVTAHGARRLPMPHRWRLREQWQRRLQRRQALEVEAAHPRGIDGRLRVQQDPPHPFYPSRPQARSPTHPRSTSASSERIGGHLVRTRSKHGVFHRAVYTAKAACSTCAPNPRRLFADDVLPPHLHRTTRWGWMARGCQSRAMAPRCCCRQAPAAASTGSSRPRRRLTPSATPQVQRVHIAVT